MRYVIAALLLALMLISTAAAQADRDVIVQLQISRTGNQGGTIKGTYNGMAVEGTYTGAGRSGSWTLVASGVILAAGTYVCDDAGCTLTGK
ncbi:MAG TPA: hypothetical protein VFW08_11555 [bacterium]|nr:hypothetical protein [bacterium]